MKDSYEDILAYLTAKNRAAHAGREQKLHHTFTSKEDRIANWQFAREDYTVWRQSEEGQKFVIQRRTRQHNLCFICLEPLAQLVHVDHIFPLFYGGTSAKTNLCLTHPACNMQKGAEVIMTYKEACRRRGLFTQIKKGVGVSETLKKKPRWKPSKKEMLCYRKAVFYGVVSEKQYGLLSHGNIPTKR